MKLRKRKQLNRKKQIRNLFKMMSKIFYDIIPPKRKRRKLAKRASLVFKPDLEVIETSIIKIVAILIIVSLNWAGLSAVYQTLAYFNDRQVSTDNIWQAGILDFELSSPADFKPSPIEAGESASRTISIINLGNQHKYTITATNFSADVCDYFNLEVSLNDGGILYSGPLKDFVDFGPTVFEDPAEWQFILTLPSDTPQEFLGQTCDFDFVFFGSQTRHDLPFGTGFTDEERISNSIATAICHDFEIRSMGYWMNHSNIYKPYLPQYLGGYPSDEIIDTVEKAQQVFNANPVPPPVNIQRIMLKKHLLAMKFNIAHFGIGGYLVESEGKTLNQIVARADDLLRDPSSTKDELEKMKDLIDGLNALGQIRYCYLVLPNVTVVVPNGGEQWWVGHYYDITWTSSDLNCLNDLSYASIWYSRDSGNTWANIIQNTENNGIYNWRIPLYLNGYYVPSGTARIKIIARCSENNLIAAWDMSDEDFCPPIDYDLLTPEEIEQLMKIGISIESVDESESMLSEETLIEELVPEEQAEEESFPVGERMVIIEGLFLSSMQSPFIAEEETENFTDTEEITEEENEKETTDEEENSDIQQAPAQEQEPVNLPEEDSGNFKESETGNGQDNTAEESENGENNETAGDVAENNENEDE